MKDEIVPFECGKQLYRLTKSKYTPWYALSSGLRVGGLQIHIMEILLKIMRESIMNALTASLSIAYNLQLLSCSLFI